MRYVCLPILLLVLSAPVCAQTLEQTGDEFRITLFHQSESKGENGSSSSSSGGHEYLERIAAVRSEGVERIYDIPLEAGDEARLVTWQFPVHILETNDGGIEILNRGEMEKRRDAWLEAADIPKESCGSWYFTWNAFQIECDPDAIIETMRMIRIQPEMPLDGAPVHHPAARDPGRLREVERNGNGIRFSALMPVDPGYIHRVDAQNDVIVGQILQRPVSFEEALAERQIEQITGTIEVNLEADANGQAWKRITVLKTERIDAGGEVERAVSTETTERRSLVGPSAG
jgi:hypothetical protein